MIVNNYLYLILNTYIIVKVFNKLGERKHDKYDKHDKSDKHDKHDKHDRSRDNSFIENDRKSVISNSKYDGKYD